MAVMRHRTRIEKRLNRLIAQTASDTTLEDIQAVIFNEDGQLPFIVYVMHIAGLFRDDGDSHIDALIPAIQDAWNYFPHSRLDGRCPTEMLLEKVPGLRPSDLRS
jgi:hypothetical protein